MVKYCDGKIYMISPVSGGEDGDIYIGSTTRERLSQRMMGHRAAYKRWKNGMVGKITSYDLFEKYGQEHCQITLIEHVNATSRDELNARERFYIETLDCVNKCIVGRTYSEWRSDNREKIAEQKSQYYQINREQIAEYKSQYQQANKEQIVKYKAEYYQANKERLIIKTRENQAKKKLQLAETDPST
jgi:lipase chaperone LimK